MSTHLTDFLEAKLVDHMLRNTAYTPSATVYLALFTAVSDGEDGSVTEVSGNNYSRKAITFAAASSRAIASAAQVEFDEASGSWGTVTHFGIYDASTDGNLLAFGDLTASKTIGSGETFVVEAGDVTLTLSGSWSTYAANKALDLVFRNQAWTSPTTVYAGLLTAYTSDASFTECADANYAREAAAFDAPTGGQTANSAELLWDAFDSGATITHVALFDADSNGNLLLRKALDEGAFVAADSRPRFIAGAMTVDIE